MEHITKDDFDEEIKNGIILIDFYANWCGPCKKLTPELEELSKEMKQVKFYKVNIDIEHELTKRFNIMSVPTILLFKEGEIVGKTSGYSPKQLIKGFIEKVM